MGWRDPIISMHWIADVESSFLASIFLVGVKFRFGTCMLCDGAGDWWHKFVYELEPGVVVSMT